MVAPKHDNEKPLKIRFCPNCKSTDVGFVFNVKTLFGILPRVKCHDCDYDSIEFPILVVKPSTLKESVAKLKKKKAMKKKTVAKKKVVKKVVKKSTKKVVKKAPVKTTKKTSVKKGSVKI
ncbi:MAG: hypothetical protein ACI83O_000155 [Patescibacteria group bacterium]|jgi:hypothetical protein